MALGISSKKWTSIIFLLATILISLALVGIPFLTPASYYENFEGYQILNKGDIDGTTLSTPDTFPKQGNTSTVKMSATAPVMPTIAIGGDFKGQMERSKPTISTTPQVKSNSVYNMVFGLDTKENFSTITSF